MKKSGYFVTFEGGEGSGKTTQLRRLAKAMQHVGRKVRVTREPGGTPAAEALREALLSGAAKDLGPLAEACLFASARADHVRHLIRPALSQGHDVLCDRFADSTRAYQGAAGVEPAMLDLLEEVALGDLRPDLTLLLDLSVEEGMNRAHARRQSSETDRFEADHHAEQERRRKAFLAMAEEEPDRFVVIDAAKSADAVEETIRRAVAERLGLHLEAAERRASS